MMQANSPSAPAVLRMLRRRFDVIRGVMESLHPVADVRPSGNESIQLVSQGDGVFHFACRPVVCSVPERGVGKSATVIIVFEANLALAASPLHEVTRIHSYATNFAYFVRSGPDEYNHALGGHYDFVPDDLTHPRSHLQLRSQSRMWEHAGARFQSLLDREVTLDPMALVLNRVRAPSAQMDFLSFMLQIAADHLVDGKSSAEARRQFRRTAAECTPFMGFDVPSTHDGLRCYRGGHWYPT